ncbi:nuclear transport factor 2 family protein [Pedobacter sp. MR22-3]|uniref:nuclear transport factor 2 family protein n=1 Tax=Pedobacter sp. MR22-3 TaxID=2994552 RepID=UPI0022483D18|nr:nuclear transport factor 2 family protein [Pedobacter sp. MR22-3]MCX2586271.1 nuclear transport factor 2 family protein [Pedobacter sp. MR22-3]
MKRILIFGCLMFVAVSSFAQQKNAEKEVDQAVSKLLALMVTPDSTKLDQLLLNNLSYGHSSGKIQNKQEFMHSLLSGESDFLDDIIIADPKTIVQGNTALVRHKLMAQTNDKGIKGSVNLYILLIWSKEKAGWKLLGRQAIKVP